ncbi:hypothetical protein CY35_14G107000 [Sphagnum magellanicum]|nr:hypothetical protein CY35_14G107000 [Sphagnum magellanicum]
MSPATKQDMLNSIELTSFIRPQINSYWDIVLTWGAEKKELEKQIEDLKDGTSTQQLKQCKNELQSRQKELERSRDDLKSCQKELERYKDNLKECEIKLRRCENRPPQYITQYVPQYVTQYVTQYVAQPVQYVTRYVTQYVTRWRTEYVTRWRTEYVTRWRTEYVYQPVYQAYNACWNYCCRGWW